MPVDASAAEGRTLVVLPASRIGALAIARRTDITNRFLALSAVALAGTSAALAVAPTVVRVVRDLPLPAVDARILAPDAARRAAAESLATRWALGESMRRILAALDGTA